MCRTFPKKPRFIICYIAVDTKPFLQPIPTKKINERQFLFLSDCNIRATLCRIVPSRLRVLLRRLGKYEPVPFACPTPMRGPECPCCQCTISAALMPVSGSEGSSSRPLSLRPSRLLFVVVRRDAPRGKSKAFYTNEVFFDSLEFNVEQWWQRICARVPDPAFCGLSSRHTVSLNCF